MDSHISYSVTALVKTWLFVKVEAGQYQQREANINYIWKQRKTLNMSNGNSKERAMDIKAHV